MKEWLCISTKGPIFVSSLIVQPWRLVKGEMETFLPRVGKGVKAQGFKGLGA